MPRFSRIWHNIYTKAMNHSMTRVLLSYSTLKTWIWNSSEVFYPWLHIKILSEIHTYMMCENEKLHWVDFYSVNKEKFSKTQLRTMNWNWVISFVLQRYWQYLFCDKNLSINELNKEYDLRESMFYLH